jgi:hypothetical protein
MTTKEIAATVESLIQGDNSQHAEEDTRADEILDRPNHGETNPRKKRHYFPDWSGDHPGSLA